MLLGSEGPAQAPPFTGRRAFSQPVTVSVNSGTSRKSQRQTRLPRGLSTRVPIPPCADYGAFVRGLERGPMGGRPHRPSAWAVGGRLPCRAGLRAGLSVCTRSPAGLRRGPRCIRGHRRTAGIFALRFVQPLSVAFPSAVWCFLKLPTLCRAVSPPELLPTSPAGVLV